MAVYIRDSKKDKTVYRVKFRNNVYTVVKVKKDTSIDVHDAANNPIYDNNLIHEIRRLIDDFENRKNDSET